MVNVTKADVQKLKRITGPAYVAGIDVVGEVGFLLAITKNTRNKTITGMPCTNPIDCTLITKLWNEVEAYWTARNMMANKSLFS